MKNKLIFSLLVFISSASFVAFGFDQISTSPSSYVVIGAFKTHDHARIWIAKAKKYNFTAITELRKSRKLWYVYTMKTDDRPVAFEQAAKIRKDSVFWDTWVYTGSFDMEEENGVDLNPVTKNPILSVNSTDITDANTKTPGLDGKNTNATNSNAAGKIGGLKNSSEKTSQSQTGSLATDKTITNSTATQSTIQPTTSSTLPATADSKMADDTKVADSLKAAAVADSVRAAEKPTVDNNTGTALPGAKDFLFKIHAAEGQAELVGKVDVIDVDRARKAGTYAGNKTVLVNPPNKSGNIFLVCQVFGYRRNQRSMNFLSPTDSGGVVIQNDLITVPFDLVRLQKGDFAVMYNVYFFKDAAVMRPESRYEVNSLVTMMKENPKYKIRIHGHTNGNASGKVVRMGDSKNFFSLVGTKDAYGSAKELSEERAKMMKRYLVEEGINDKRMEIKAWGGKKPVYDKMSPQAQANVRVEIEIIEDK